MGKAKSNVKNKAEKGQGWISFPGQHFKGASQIFRLANANCGQSSSRNSADLISKVGLEFFEVQITKQKDSQFLPTQLPAFYHAINHWHHKQTQGSRNQ